MFVGRNPEEMELADVREKKGKLKAYLGLHKRRYWKTIRTFRTAAEATNWARSKGFKILRTVRERASERASKPPVRIKFKTEMRHGRTAYRFFIHYFRGVGDEGTYYDPQQGLDNVINKLIKSGYPIDDIQIPPGATVAR